MSIQKEVNYFFSIVFERPHMKVRSCAVQAKKTFLQD